MRLSPGDVAPDFELLDADEHPVSSMTFRGRRLLVYFYPAALTPGCTTQACDFRDNLRVLDTAGLAVVGVSPDLPEKLRKFRATHDLVEHAFYNVKATGHVAKLLRDLKLAA